MKTGNNKKIKLLLLSELPPPRHGVSIMNSQTFCALSDTNKYQIYTITTKFLQLNFKRFKIILRMLHFFKITAKLLYFLIRNKVDVAYTNISPSGKQFYLDCIFCWVLNALFKTKTIVHIHGVGMSKNKPEFVFKMMRRIFNRLSFIHLSERFRADLEPLVNNNNIHIVTNGLPQLSSRVPKFPEVITISFYSNICEPKGIFLFLDLIKRLKSESNIKFLIAGAYMSGFSEEVLRNYLNDEKLSEQLTVLGKIESDAEKDTLLRTTDILVHPTYNDALPLVLIEALDYGVAIVTTDVGAIRDIVSDHENGYVCNVGDLDDISAKVCYLIENNSLLKVIAENNQKKFDQLFSLSTYNANINRVFEKVLTVPK
ncbi:MAG: glycosyltransferase family 4 protein [Colwellia sp.]